MMKVAALLLTSCVLWAAAPARIVLVAGKPSHAPGAHEHNAGVLLMAKWLRQNRAEAVVVKGGWPPDAAVFQGARSVVFYLDGGKNNPMFGEGRREVLARLMRQGVGLVLLHYALDPGDYRDDFLEWAGGYWERGYSANPINDVAVTRASPEHPVSRGWKGFAGNDEWYYRLRFRPHDARVTPILTTLLPKDAPQKEVIGWVVERAGGGRSFCFTGGHFHSNWGLPDQRRMVTNGILWTAGLPIPRRGARCDVSAEELIQNLDDKPAPKKK